MNNRVCVRNENIVRAIQKNHFHPQKNRFSSSLFAGPNISVSRLSVLPLSGIFEIFHRDLKDVTAAGEINVGVIQDIGKQENQPQEITVEIDPLPENPAHAQIPQELSRSLASKIEPLAGDS